MNGFFEYFYVHKNLNPRSFTEGVAYYLSELSYNYFYDEWLFYIAAALFLFALLDYKRQSLGGRVAVLCGTITLAMVFTHQMKESRFLFLVMIPFWATVALVGARLLGKISSNRIFDMVTAIIIAIAAIFLFDSTIKDERFKKLALIQYTNSEEIDRAFEAVRNKLSVNARLGVLGKSDALSPALFTWQLGAPKGFRDYQDVIEIEKSYPVYKTKVDMLVAEKKVRLVKGFPIRSKNLSFELYELGKQAKK
jgi:hypothetical protein